MPSRREFEKIYEAALKERAPRMFQALEASGRLVQHIMETADQMENTADQMLHQLRRTDPAPKNDFLGTAQKMQQWEAQIRERVIHDFVANLGDDEPHPK